MELESQAREGPLRKLGKRRLRSRRKRSLDHSVNRPAGSEVHELAGARHGIRLRGQRERNGRVALRAVSRKRVGRRAYAGHFWRTSNHGSRCRRDVRAPSHPPMTSRQAQARDGFCRCGDEGDR